MTGETWAHLRATRSNPPGDSAEDDARRRTYVSALEQAEQLFRAAARIGPATQPLLIFYGLSQAGRAIAAAARNQDPDINSWRLAGHGIRAVSSTLSGPLQDIRVRTDDPAGQGSFVRLSRLLDSPSWGKEDVPLARLWDLLPETRDWPVTDDAKSRRTPLYIEHRSLYPESHPLVSVPVTYFPPWLINSGKREDLDEYLSAYPEAAQYHSFVQRSHDNSEPAFERHVDGWGELQMNWMVLDGRSASVDDRVEYLRNVGRPYCGSLYLFPSVAENMRSIHPLMAWWSVLYALSMLARYQPDEWWTVIDVDQSRTAVAIERLLSEAIYRVPQLIVDAIDHVTRGQSILSPQ